MASSVLVELQATTSEFLAKMSEAEASVKKLGTNSSANLQKFQAVGKVALAAVAAGTVAVAAKSVEMAMAFDDSTAKIQGNAQITAAAAKSIGDAFLHTAGDSTFSGKEMNDAFGPVAGVVQALAGHTLTAADATKLMAGAADLAEASGQPLATTTADLSAVMQAYGLNLNQTTEASNELFNISRLTGINLDTLSDTVDKLHGRLGIAAPDLAQTGALMVDLAQHGISGSKGVMVVNTALTTLLGGTKPVQDELQKLGVSVFDSSGKFIGMQAAIGQLQPKLAGMSDEQRTAAESVLFGTTAGVAMNATIMAGSAAYAQATSAVTQNNAVQKAAEASSSTLEGRYKTLKASVKDYVTEIGEKLIPIITEVTAWIEKHQALAEALAITVGTVLVVAIGAYAVSMAAAAVATIAATWPILAIIAAVAAVGVGIALLATHWSEVWAAIKAVVSDAVDWVRSHLLEVSAAFGPLGLAAYELGHNWSSIWSGIQTAVSAVWGVIKPIFDEIKGAISDITGGISKVTGLANKLTGGGAVKSLLGHIPGLAAGGVVKAQPGGTLVNIGEGGKDEAVVPLGGSPNISPLGTLAGGLVSGGSAAAGATTIHVEVKGNVISQTDLVNAIHAGLLQKQNRNGQLGFR